MKTEVKDSKTTINGKVIPDRSTKPALNNKPSKVDVDTKTPEKKEKTERPVEDLIDNGAPEEKETIKSSIGEPDQESPQKKPEEEKKKQTVTEKVKKDIKSTGAEQNVSDERNKEVTISPILKKVRLWVQRYSYFAYTQLSSLSSGLFFIFQTVLSPEHPVFRYKRLMQLCVVKKVVGLLHTGA